MKQPLQSEVILKRKGEKYSYFKSRSSLWEIHVLGMKFNLCDKVNYCPIYTYLL